SVALSALSAICAVSASRTLRTLRPLGAGGQLDLVDVRARLLDGVHDLVVVRDVGLGALDGGIGESDVPGSQSGLLSRWWCRCSRSRRARRAESRERSSRSPAPG